MALDLLDNAAGQDKWTDAYTKLNAAIAAINALAGGTADQVFVKIDGTDFNFTARNSVLSDSANLKVKVIEIGDWNMDTTNAVSVIHGIVDGTKIRSVDVVIRADTGVLYKLENYDFSTGEVGGGVSGVNEDIPISGTTIRLGRKTGGLFDQAGFDSTSFNRGFITIIYEV